MKVLVTYFSQSGNTEKIAKAIWEEASQANEADLKKLEDITPGGVAGYDFIFIGSPLHSGSLAAPVLAGSADGNTNLFESAGKKQTNKDFKPAPDKIKTNFGTLKFELDAFPTDKSVQKIYDEMDLQRATQAYMDFYPALSVYAIVKSQIRDFKFQSSSDIAIAAGPGCPAPFFRSWCY